MKTKFSLLLFCLCLASFSFSQTEKINQLNSDGKKDGKWIVYLNDKGKEIKDSTQAVYCRYSFYDNGVNICPMGPFIGKNEKIVPPENSSTQSGKIKLLDGEYKCLDKNGRTKYVHVFNKGEYIFYKEFYPDGKLSEYFDYTKKHIEKGKEEPHTYLMEIHDKKGTVKYYYMRKVQNRWMAYGINAPQM